MNGLIDQLPADVVATWVAAIVTLVVLGGLLGERRLFGWSQHLLAGLATGFLALLAIREVLVPRVLQPLVDDPGERIDLWILLIVGGLAAAAPWLPRAVAAVPISVAVGSLAAFALGGAIVGTLIPQLGATVARPSADPGETAVAVGSAAVSALVLVGFLHGGKRGRIVGGAASAGRVLLIGGLGAWLGYLLLSRLLLLLDRIGFLLGDWLRLPL